VRLILASNENYVFWNFSSALADARHGKDDDAERLGLDLSQHDENAYAWEAW